MIGLTILTLLNWPFDPDSLIFEMEVGLLIKSS